MRRRARRASCSSRSCRIFGKVSKNPFARAAKDCDNAGFIHQTSKNRRCIFSCKQAIRIRKTFRASQLDTSPVSCLSNHPETFSCTKAMHGAQHKHLPKAFTNEECSKSAFRGPCNDSRKAGPLMQGTQSVNPHTNNVQTFFKLVNPLSTHQHLHLPHINFYIIVHCITSQKPLGETKQVRTREHTRT